MIKKDIRDLQSELIQMLKEKAPGIEEKQPNEGISGL